MTITHTPEHSSPDSLWDTLAHFIAGAISMFGDAKALALRMLLSRKEYMFARQWLWRCEELLRRLIFIDAVQVLRDQAPVELRAMGLNAMEVKSSRDRKPSNLLTPSPSGGGGDPSAPETWRVSFALLPRIGRSRAGAHANLGHGTRFQFGEFVDVAQAKQQALDFAKQRRAMFTLPASAAPERNGPPAPARGQAASLVPSKALARRFEALMRAAQYPTRQAKRLARWLARHRSCAALFTQPTRSHYSLRRKPGDRAVADAAYFARQAWRACDSS